MKQCFLVGWLAGWGLGWILIWVGFFGWLVLWVFVSLVLSNFQTRDFRQENNSKTLPNHMIKFFLITFLKLCLFPTAQAESHLQAPFPRLAF